MKNQLNLNLVELAKKLMVTSVFVILCVIANAQTLRLVAKAKGKFIGSAANSAIFYKDPAIAKDYKNILAKEFNMIVAENEMKMGVLLPSEGNYNWSKADALVAFAEKNNMRLRGHTLVWHNQLPKFISNPITPWTRETLLAEMKNHINAVVGRYKGKVKEWDVVNEALNDPPAKGIRMTSIWAKVIGEDFIDSAFVYAHQADPKADLYYNDYNIEYNFNTKTQSLLSLVKRLKQQHIPIHGVGLQSHSNYNLKDSEIANLSKFVDSLAVLGMKVALTEVDLGIPKGAVNDSTLNVQANSYAKLTQLFMNKSAIKSMVFWGFTDAYTWLEERPKPKEQPLLFDKNLIKKQAYYSVYNTIKN